MKKLIFLLLLSLVASAAVAQFLTQPVYGTLQVQAQDRSSGTLQDAIYDVVTVTADVSPSETYGRYWRDPVVYATVTEEVTTGVILKSKYRCNQYGNSVYCKLTDRKLQPYSPVRVKDKIKRLNEGYILSQAEAWQ